MIRDIVYALALRTYLNTSARRVQSDLKIAREAQYMEQEIHFNTFLDHLESSELKNVLKELIELSALPLKQVETDFAVDATGFSTSIFERWFDVRILRDSKKRLWRKCHAMCGVKTNIITSVDISSAYVHDSELFSSIVSSTARNFDIREVSADKGYLAKAHYNLVRDLGGQAYIPFKSNSNGKSKTGGDSYTWRTMFRYFRDHQEEFMAKYHKRSNIESCFSMIKRKFGNNVRCKKTLSQDNEILAKVLVNNICILIQEIFLNQIHIDFLSCAEGYVAQK